ncbi:MAG: sigma-70 family RNA polymerase sigma factor, partial [Variovorax sp.]
MNEDDPDAPLLARMGRGEPQAVRDMVARKLPRLLSLAQRLLGRRSEAEEVAQEAFVRIWKQAGHWQSGPARFDTWLHRVALNLCYDRLRNRRDEEPYDQSHEVADPAAVPDEALQAAQRSRRVAAA